MIGYLLIVTVLFLNVMAIFPYTHLEVPIELSDELGSNYTLVFGVDSSATNTWDPTLGEYNIFRMPPPGKTFHAAFEIFDSVNLQELVWTYKDFRPIIDSSQYFVQYAISVNRGDGALLIFNWGLMPEYIDSARITDREEDLDLEDFNLKGTKRSDTVRNTSHNDFYVKVWYHNPPNYVVNENDNQEFTIYPLPADGNKIILRALSPGFSFKIYSETGMELITGNTRADKTELNIEDLTKGIYFIVINSGSREIVRKLIRL